MSQHHVNPDLIHRTAWGNPLWNALHNLNITGLCLAGSIITALIWPLALPVCLLFTLVTSVIFMLQRWRCPLRMPMTLSLDDPSQDRKVRRSLFSFWPTLFQYEADETFPARGIFYVGYRRINDIGRELWLSMDDLTRHVMFFATTGGGKTETTFAWLLNRSAGEEALPLLTERHRTIPRGQSGISPDVLAGRMISKSSTS